MVRGALIVTLVLGAIPLAVLGFQWPTLIVWLLATAVYWLQLWAFGMSHIIEGGIAAVLVALIGTSVAFNIEKQQADARARATQIRQQH